MAAFWTRTGGWRRWFFGRRFVGQGPGGGERRSEGWGPRRGASAHRRAFTSRSDEGRRHGRDDTVRWPACAAGFAFFRSRLSDCVERLPVHAFVKLSKRLTASVEVGPVLVEQHAGALPDEADRGIGAEVMLVPDDVEHGTRRFRPAVTSEASDSELQPELDGGPIRPLSRSAGPDLLAGHSSL